MICSLAKRFANKLGNDYWFGLVWFRMYDVFGTVAHELYRSSSLFQGHNDQWYKFSRKK